MASDGSAPARAGAGRGWAEAVVVAALGVAAAAFVWFLARPRGLGVTNDGVAYLATSDSLLRGDGPGYWLQQPLVAWPLLYPALLAGVRRVSGVDGLGAALVVAMATSGLTALFAWRVARRTLARLPLRLAVVAVAVLAPATVVLVDKVLTDALFAAGTLAFLLALQRAVTTGRSRWVVTAAVVVWLLFGTRYAGVGYVAIGAAALALLPAGRPGAARARAAAGFAVVAAVVPVLYALRNRAVSGSLLGMDRSTSTSSGASALGVVPRSFVGWAVTRTAERPVVTLVGVALVAALAAVAVLCVLRARCPRPASDTPADAATASDALDAPDAPAGGGEALAVDRAVVAVVWLGLVGWFLVLRLVVFFDLDARTMAALFPVSLLLVAIGVDRAADRLGGRAAAVVVAAFAVWAVTVVAVGVHDGLAFRREGSGYLERDLDDVYRELAAADLDALPPGCELHTNQPNVTYFAGLEAPFTPWAGRAESGAGSTAGPRRCVVWIDGGPPPAVELAPLEEVQAAWDLERTFAGERVQVLVARS